MKRKILAIILLTFLLVGCNNIQKEVIDENKKTVTVTTSFLYDMVDRLAGDYVNRRLIIPAGEDPHLYVAKPRDLEKILDTDLLLYHGLHFEGKMSEVLEKRGYAATENFKSEEVGRMQQDGSEIIDPHFWFDINLYKKATKNISNRLVEFLPEHKREIENNTLNYLKELDDLDRENRKLLSEIPEDRRFLITPHDAFNYFSSYYNIPVLAPQGMSTNSEVANKEIQGTVDFIIEHKIKAIFAESTTDPARMDKLKEAALSKNFDVKVVKGDNNELFSDSLAASGEVGDTYISMYRHNIKLIVDNLK